MWLLSGRKHHNTNDHYVHELRASSASCPRAETRESMAARVPRQVDGEVSGSDPHTASSKITLEASTSHDCHEAV